MDLIVTSPPYYNLRNYKHRDQIGREETQHAYLYNLEEVFRECKRVLKKTGSIWVNISDTYDKKGCLFGIPERFALSMTDNLNLIRRNTIIWYKPNCMPSGVKNRFTIDFEYFYFFTKSGKYKFNTQYNPYAESTLAQFKKPYTGIGLKDYESNGVQNPSNLKRRIIKFGGNKYPNQVNSSYSGNDWKPKSEGSLMRCVWKLSPNNFTGNHFATYPEKLIETPIKSCTDLDGIVLDPFNGSGTTCLTAKKMNRRYIGIDLNPEYVKQARNRLESIL